MNEGGKGLWHNMRQRRKKGLPRKKPGQKGYPKTLKIGESNLRALVRESLINEYGFIEASYMGSGRYWEAITGILQDMFGPTKEDRLKRAGDDKVIDRYQTFMGTLHLMPEYKMVWDNYKKAQNRHASMDRDFDRARDIRHPVGRAFSKLKSKVLMKFDELEETLSPETRDIWQESVDEMRGIFEKLFRDWYLSKITTGRVLAQLDPRGVVESRIRRVKISEAGEMFAGRDLEQLQMSEFLAALEMADMDLEDAGCPAESDARVMLEELMVMIDSGRERQGFSSANFASTAEDVISAIRSCRQVDMREAQRISADLEMALSKAQEAERF
jgi:hypothetical protein